MPTKFRFCTQHSPPSGFLYNCDMTSYTDIKELTDSRMIEFS